MKRSVWILVVSLLIVSLGLVGYLGWKYYQRGLVEEVAPETEWTESKKEMTAAEKCYTDFVDSRSKAKGLGMVDPATVFCGCMGGETKIKETATGQRGLCIIEGETYDEWEYFDKMNPYDNGFSQAPVGYDEWVKFCRENRESVYCRNFEQ